MDGVLAEDLLSGDRGRVLAALWAVVRTRDPAVLGPLVPVLPEIERATAGLDLGGALLSNQANLRHAIDRVRLHAAGRCLCAAYPDHPRYEPVREEAAGHVRVVEEVAPVVDGRPTRPRRTCVCTGCGQRWDVEEGDYHYTWWQWRAVPPAE